MGGGSFEPWSDSALLGFLVPGSPGNVLSADLLWASQSVLHEQWLEGNVCPGQPAHGQHRNLGFWVSLSLPLFAGLSIWFYKPLSRLVSLERHRAVRDPLGSEIEPAHPPPKAWRSVVSPRGGSGCVSRSPRPETGACARPFCTCLSSPACLLLTGIRTAHLPQHSALSPHSGWKAHMILDALLEWLI